MFTAFVCAIFFLAAGADSYAKPELLVEPRGWVPPHQFVILDARDKAAYEKGHIPGALRVDGPEWAKAFGKGDDVKGWSQRIGVMGINEQTPVVVYDDAKSKDAARIWWILRYWDVRDVRILNGGWREWQANERPTQTITAMTKALNFDAKAARERSATREQLLKSLENNSLQIVDARSQGEHCGTDRLKNQRGGSIPGAKHLEWSDLVDDKTHRFKPGNEIEQLLHKAGIDVKKPTVAYCQSGGRAAVMAFALELMGGENVANYHPSWGEWGNDPTTPIEKKK